MKASSQKLRRILKDLSNKVPLFIPPPAAAVINISNHFELSLNFLLVPENVAGLQWWGSCVTIPIMFGGTKIAHSGYASSDMSKIILLGQYENKITSTFELQEVCSAVNSATKKLSSSMPSSKPTTAHQFAISVINIRSYRLLSWRTRAAVKKENACSRASMCE